MARAGQTQPEIHPVTADRWDDMVQLFSTPGQASRCWDMWFRRPRREFWADGIDGNRKAMGRIVSSNEIPGLLAYRGERAVGWCSVSQRDQYPSLLRSRFLKRVDDTPVWSIVCFYILPEGATSAWPRVCWERR